MRDKLRDETRLLHMLDAIQKIERFTSNVRQEDFEADSILYFAIVKNLEIIGEAAYKLTNEFRESHPHTPWKIIIGMRHCLVHGYYQISIEETWNTITNDLTPLKTQITTYLTEFPSTDTDTM